jgi:hypothetical protein
MLKFWQELLNLRASASNIEQNLKGNELVLSAVVACGAGCVLLRVEDFSKDREEASDSTSFSGSAANQAERTRRLRIHIVGPTGH